MESGLKWLKFIFQRRVRTALPDEEVFNNPPLIEWRMRIVGFTRRQRYRKRLEAYSTALEELIASGWTPDLVHAHSANLGGLAARQMKERHEIPYLITEHKPFALCNYPEEMREDVKRCFLDADVVLSLGYDKVRQLGMSDISVEPNLIFNFVDENFFDKVADAYKPRQPLKLLSIGAASHYKDHRTLLRAMKILKERSVPFKLTLCGLKVWGGLYNETLDFIQRNDLEADVEVIDRLGRAEVRDLLAEHNVFLMTSIAEGFPVSVLEALAAGLFVVSTRHGGTEDILTPEMGALVEIKNHQKIAERIEEIYAGRIQFDPKRIRESVISICGQKAFKRRLINYYQKALGEPA